ncbi:MAG: hypothetical protein HZB70_02755 [Candidatus Berkelbacteria bacterium]|nr:MAG: hypothetical protein HZB70_02755 [Candidatus Berkelbacteria bacterium]QQG51773.1 MAG: hypothetical protein HY845_00240 [Candidatus Berkelbacteria bacterium]
MRKLIALFVIVLVATFATAQKIPDEWGQQQQTPPPTKQTHACNRPDCPVPDCTKMHSQCSQGHWDCEKAHKMCETCGQEDCVIDHTKGGTGEGNGLGKSDIESIRFELESAKNEIERLRAAEKAAVDARNEAERLAAERERARVSNRIKREVNRRSSAYKSAKSSGNRAATTKEGLKLSAWLGEVEKVAKIKDIAQWYKTNHEALSEIAGARNAIKWLNEQYGKNGTGPMPAMIDDWSVAKDTLGEKPIQRLNNRQSNVEAYLAKGGYDSNIDYTTTSVPTTEESTGGTTSTPTEEQPTEPSGPAWYDIAINWLVANWLWFVVVILSLGLAWFILKVGVPFIGGWMAARNTPAPPPTVTRNIDTITGPIAGGDAFSIMVTGHGRRTKVVFEEIVGAGTGAVYQATNLKYYADAIEGKTPLVAHPGTYRVHVVNRDGTSALAGTFDYT